MASVADLLLAPVHIRAEEHVAAFKERVSPPLAVESSMVGAEHAFKNLSADRSGQYPVIVRRSPRRMREMSDPDVWAHVSQHPRHQTEVIIVDHRPDRAARSRPTLGRRARLVR